MTTFKYLFSPMKIGSKEVKNRIVFPARDTNYNKEQSKSNMETLAKGGVGLIITGATLMHPPGAGWPFHLDEFYDH